MSETEYEGGDETETEAPVETEPTVEASQEEAVWAPSRDEWERMNQTVASVAQWFDQAAQYTSREDVVEQEELDPWSDPAGFKDAIVREIQQSLQPVVQPLAEKQSEELVTGWADEIETKVGKYDRELATEKAFALRAVNPGLDGRTALEHAAKATKERDERIAREAVEAYKQSLQTPVTDEPGVNGGALHIEDRPSSYDAIIRKHALLNERQ